MVAFFEQVPTFSGSFGSQAVQWSVVPADASGAAWPGTCRHWRVLAHLATQVRAPLIIASSASEPPAPWPRWGP